MERQSASAATAYGIALFEILRQYRARMIQLDLYNRTKTRVSRKMFDLLLVSAQKVLAREKIIRTAQNFLVELTIVGNKKITELNALYHKKNRPTDVISLSFFEEKDNDPSGRASARLSHYRPDVMMEGHPLVGEIFICLPYARAQAGKIGQSLSEELRFLFVHGLLHVFGYDHMKPREEARMKKLTYEVLGR